MKKITTRIIQGFDWWKVGIITIAIFLRVFQIYSINEFLGDQGRTMLVMKDFLESGIIPLSGPTTLSGHHLGPVFYYLLVPGYFIVDGPVGVSLWMAILGVVSVVLMYETSKKMFGIWPARAASVMWALSPNKIISDRVIWEPNLVPLFSLLFIYLLYKAHHESKNGLWFLLGATVGVLVQLHYPNLIFIFLYALYMSVAIVLQKISLKSALVSVWYWFAGFVVLLIPFIIYELRVGFFDIAGIISVIESGGGAPLGKRTMLLLAWDYSFRVLSFTLPYMTKNFALIVLSVWTVIALLKPTRLRLFLSLWFFIGITAMARYSGVVHDHYLYFLMPIPPLMIASLLRPSSKSSSRFAFLFIVVIVLLQSIRLLSLDTRDSDMLRVSAVVNSVKRHAEGNAFAFTLINSDSFSDLHYRYYFSKLGVDLQSILDDEASSLYIICDNNQCPTTKEISNNRDIGVLCFDHHCSGEYPRINMAKTWKFKSGYKIQESPNVSANVYHFIRR